MEKVNYFYYKYIKVELNIAVLSSVFPGFSEVQIMLISTLWKQMSSLNHVSKVFQQSNVFNLTSLGACSYYCSNNTDEIK